MKDSLLKFCSCGSLFFALGLLCIGTTYPLHDKVQNFDIFHPRWWAFISSIFLLSSKQQSLNFLNWCDRNQKKIILLTSVLTTLIIIKIKLVQHYTFNTGGYDLALYETAIRNTIKGQFLFSDQLSRTFFSEHFSPILLLFVPIYYIFDTPIVLFVALGISIGVLFNLLTKFGFSLGLGTFESLLLSQFVIQSRLIAPSVMFDFHPETFLPAIIIWGLLSLKNEKFLQFWLSMILALSIKEDVPIITASLALYMLFKPLYRKHGYILLILSLLWAALAWYLIIPSSWPAQQNASHFLERWGHLGDSYLSVAIEIMLSPLYTASSIFNGILRIIIEFGGIFLLAPELIIITIPTLILNTTSSFDLQAQLQLHYIAPVAPFIALGFFIGWKRLKKFLPPSYNYILLIALLLVTSLTFYRRYPNYYLTNEIVERHQGLSLIPQGSIVTAQTNFIPHLIRDHEVYLYPDQFGRGSSMSEWIVTDTKGFPWPSTREQIKVEQNSSTYITIYGKDGMVIKKNQNFKGLEVRL